jgi:hypothetical protein
MGFRGKLEKVRCVKDFLCCHFSRALTLFRIGCLLYLFDLLLQIETRTPSKGNCREFLHMLLPCVRELWEPISDRDWKKRYQEYIDNNKRKARRGLTLGHLLLLRQYSSKFEEPAFAEELAEWCERADDLSMLLWMALTVEGEGQSRIYRGEELSLGYKLL